MSVFLVNILTINSWLCASGQTKFNQIATLRWDGTTAQARMDNLLSANYTDKTLNAVFSPYDPISLGIISSLKGIHG